MKSHKLAIVTKELILDLLEKLPRAVFIYFVLLTGAGYLGSWHQYLEMSSHFRLQYFALSLFFLLLFTILRAWRWAFVGVICALINGVAVIPWYLPKASVQAGSSHQHLRLLLANVYVANTNYAPLLELVRAERPDVVAVQELNPGWVAELQNLSELLPYQQIPNRQDAFGIGLLSRLPLEESRVLSLGGAHLPSIFAKIRVGGETISLLTTHPPTPVGGDFYYRNDQLRAISSLVRSWSGPVIVIGDLNTTMWSPYYSRLIRETGLTDVRRGFGVLPTWPAPSGIKLILRELGLPDDSNLPLASWGLMRIPIDHCLISPDLHVAQLRTGHDVGSDHLPLIVDLSVPQSSPQPSPSTAARDSHSVSP
jgi:endonuclease/exonuclease/phosphatase (EEP) superfamily protein YafD